jgi:cellulose synthase/poly-beta-1,6-N-acetylglucosamine synthase-like glycosyltransferase
MSKDDPYIVCIIPTRGDRPRMLQRCIEMMSKQTLQPVEVFLMNDPPVDPEKKDITWRYRRAFEDVIKRHPNVELILLIEDDDWYSNAYIEVFYRSWIENGRPDIFGIGETYYYHIGLRSFNHQIHVDRASAFSTGVTKAIENMKWPDDEYSFVDIEMWNQIKGKTFIVNPPICIGMKGHEEGMMFGGIGHNRNWSGYTNEDYTLDWIGSIMDEESIDFYFSNQGPIGIEGRCGPLEKEMF